MSFQQCEHASQDVPGRDTAPTHCCFVIEQAHATGTVRVWNELYSAKTALNAVLPRDDARWRRVGLSISKPRLTDLKHVFRTISTGSFVVYDGSDLDWMP